MPCFTLTGLWILQPTLITSTRLIPCIMSMKDEVRNGSQPEDKSAHNFNTKVSFCTIIICLSHRWYRLGNFCVKTIVCKFFVALNFCSTAHQWNDQCGDVRMSCCYAMVTGIPTDFKAFFWAVSPARPALLTSLVDLRPPKERRATEIFWDRGVHLRA